MCVGRGADGEEDDEQEGLEVEECGLGGVSLGNGGMGRGGTILEEDNEVVVRVGGG